MIVVSNLFVDLGWRWQIDFLPYLKTQVAYTLHDMYWYLKFLTKVYSVFPKACCQLRKAHFAGDLAL